jgi:hypothetical protein
MTPHTLPTTPLGWLPHLWQTVLFPGRPARDTGIRWHAFLLVVVLPALLLYPFRAFHLLEPDEGRYAQIPKEMLVSGQWVVPTLQSEPYLDKPPLMYWLVAISYSVFGVTPEAARLVPAVCVHLTVLLVYLIGRRGSGERPAFWAAMLLSVAPGFVGVARLLLLDGLLTLCVTASVLCGFEAVRTGVLLRRWWYLSAVASGLGFLTKGPISEVLLLPPLFAFGWLSGSTARVGWRSLLGFAGVVLAVNLPWYAAMMIHAPAFLKYFFIEHNVMRFLQPFDHLQPIWYYLPILLGGLLPGSFLGISYVRWLLFSGSDVAERRSVTGGFWLLAGGWCVLFFSLSGSKLPTYILPAFPFLCLALGEFVVSAGRQRLAGTLVTVFGGIVLSVHAFGVPWYARGTLTVRSAGFGGPVRDRSTGAGRHVPAERRLCGLLHRPGRLRSGAKQRRQSTHGGHAPSTADGRVVHASALVRRLPRSPAGQPVGRGRGEPETAGPLGVGQAHRRHAVGLGRSRGDRTGGHGPWPTTVTKRRIRSHPFTSSPRRLGGVIVPVIDGFGRLGPWNARFSATIKTTRIAGGAGLCGTRRPETLPCYTICSCRRFGEPAQSL